MCSILTHNTGRAAHHPMTNFDEVIPRRDSGSTKWTRYDPEVLPFWVADMDFRAPDFILDAIRKRVDHGIIGYTRPPTSLADAFRAWLTHHYGWQVPEEWLVWLPGVVPGLNLAARAAATGGEVLMPTPVYYPFLDVPTHCGGQRVDSPLVRDADCWRMDFDDIAAKARTADVFLLSNPQNPTGRAYSTQELQTLADICAEHDVVMVSDEIHSAIILDDKRKHVPIAPLNPKMRCISLYAPTKTYNIPGLSCAVAVIADDALRESFTEARAGLVGTPGPLAYTACEAAFRDRSSWVPELLEYLRGNQERLMAVAGERMTTVEATYLAWIDVRDIAEREAIEPHFLRHGLGLSIGAQFAGDGWVRFNFACPRATLDAGLERLAKALA